MITIYLGCVATLDLSLLGCVKMQFDSGRRGTGNAYSSAYYIWQRISYIVAYIFEVAVGEEGKNDVHFVFFTAYRLQSSIGPFEIAGIILL